MFQTKSVEYLKILFPSLRNGNRLTSSDLSQHTVQSDTASLKCSDLPIHSLNIFRTHQASSDVPEPSHMSASALGSPAHRPCHGT